VFILVAVDAQVFPVRAVRGIVPAVPVFMVHSQQMPSLVVELPCALGAYESVNLERSFPVVAGRGSLLSQFPDDLFNGSAFPSLFWPSRFASLQSADFVACPWTTPFRGETFILSPFHDCSLNPKNSAQRPH
jgi:hypothetical protein